MTRHVENDRNPTAPQPPPPAVRMCAGDRRQQIAEVAMRLFSERGFRGTTTKEIAQAAGVSEAIIFRHFATKEELYTAIIDYKGCGGAAATAAAAGRPGQPPVIDELRALVDDAMEASDDLAVFQRVAQHMLEHHEEDPEFLRLLMYIALENHSLGSVFWDKNVRVLYEFLGGYIRRRQREGAFRDVEPNAAVRVLIGSVIHHSLSNLLWDKDPARRILRVTNEEAARQFAEILLRGIAADPDAVGARRAEATKRPNRNREGGADVKNHRDKNKKR
jgi:AcrR family transcriptional regulator